MQHVNQLYLAEVVESSKLHAYSLDCLGELIFITSELSISSGGPLFP